MNVRNSDQRRSDWCDCTQPTVEKLKLWGAVQCGDCKRPISEAKLKLTEPFPP